MKHISTIQMSILAAVFAGGMSVTAIAQERTAAANVDSTTPALAEISANREVTIGNIVNQFSSEATSLGYLTDDGQWTSEFTALLEGASDEQLLAIKNASSYAKVKDILLGGTDASAISESLAGADVLGDVNRDLVFTPVVPCRIFDTRYDIYAKPVNGTTLSYYVWGSAALLAPQGHNLGSATGIGCPSPRGEPVGIAANFTVANAVANGNIRAWPYGSTMPNVSFLNYQAGVNLANAGIIATCYGCARDMSVRTSFGSSDSLADVMGYFYPVSDGHDTYMASGGTHTGFPNTDNLVYRFVGPTVTRSINGGDEIYMTANQALGATVSANNLDIAPCYKSTLATNPSIVGAAIFDLSSSAGNRIPVNVNGRFILSPGTYQFGMCYRTNSAGWNNNEYGYVTVLHINKFN